MPEKKFSAGAITATIWKNKGKRKDGVEFEFHTVNVERNYKDGEEWKKTNSHRLNDLPRVALVANQAFKYLVSKESEDE